MTENTTNAKTLAHNQTATHSPSQWNSYMYIPANQTTRPDPGHNKSVNFSLKLSSRNPYHGENHKPTIINAY